MFIKTLTFILFFVWVNAVYEGDSCLKNDVIGTCTNIRFCQSAIDDLKNRIYPQICSYSGSDPIVCCVGNTQSQTTTQRPVATTSTVSTTSTTAYVPPVYDYLELEDKGGGCSALSANLTSKKTGQKAWDKCIDYQEKLVYPCERTVALAGQMGRVNYCHHNADELIVGGVNAANGEFPHMALLGYGDNPKTAQWLCGGSLISDRFILTAGHCTSSRDFGSVSYVTVGILKRSDEVDSTKLYKIKNVIKHPDYKPPVKYNDIALLETETPVNLNDYVVPACLHIGNSINDDRALATGWGLTEYRGSDANILQKVTLTKFTRDECSEKFPVQRLMKQGYNDATQMCYGDKTRSKDSCQGDSGGPLQIKSKNVHCMYTIIGVTSFGKACGFVGEPGIYTRVSAFVPWIESIVWP